MEYKTVAYCHDDDRSWTVTIYSHYRTFQEAEKAGYDFVKRYENTQFPVDCFQVLEST